MTVIKIGGRPLSDAASLNLLIDELSALQKREPLLLVHGGGNEVTDLSKRLGIETRFQDGIRLTSPAEMELVSMVLAGKMNTLLVRRLVAAGIRAVGLSGCDAGSITGAPLSAESRTGKVTGVQPGLVQDLTRAGYLPVCSSVSADQEGEALNINADEAALALAVALRAERLIFLADVPGILKEERLLPRLSAEEAEREIVTGTIAGGMIPKVRASFAGLAQGVGEVIIGGIKRSGDLSALIDGTGTHLHH